MFAPLAPSVQFTAVEPAFTKVKYVRASAWFLPFILIAAGVGIWLRTWWPFAVMGAFLILYVWDLLLIVRRVRAMGYFEGEEELILCNGLMFQRIEVIPYGRLQQVNVATGPLLKRYGLASIEFVTASAQTSGSIPGVRSEEAERLRVKLTALGTANLEGF